jgi:hypothetical protein
MVVGCTWHETAYGATGSAHGVISTTSLTRHDEDHLYHRAGRGQAALRWYQLHTPEPALEPARGRNRAPRHHDPWHRRRRSYTRRGEDCICQRRRSRAAYPGTANSNATAAKPAGGHVQQKTRYPLQLVGQPTKAGVGWQLEAGSEHAHVVHWKTVELPSCRVLTRVDQIG